jgi:Fe-Mn family superoxide dismutase
MPNNKLPRRKFLQNTLTASAGAVLLPSWVKSFDLTNTNNDFSFVQAPLPYAYNALEPFIDAATMELHYTKHAAGYAKNVQEALKEEYLKRDVPQLTRILQEINLYSAKMRNNAGGHYNHELFWQLMQPPQHNNLPKGVLLDKINKTFESFDKFKQQFTDAALKRFGSGWAWLIMNEKHELQITSTPNQDNPLMPIAEVKGYPLLALDVWEHAYYLLYKNRRAEYINNWWNVVNWVNVEKRYQSIN